MNVSALMKALGAMSLALVLVASGVTSAFAQWSGPWVGVHGGVANSTTSILGLIDDTDNEFVGGISAGFDVRLGRTVVVGVFTDYTFMDVSAAFGPATVSLDEQWTIGGRAGVLLGDVLAYVMLGAVQQATGDNIPTVTVSDFDGMMYGVGAEALITNNISLAGEVRYVTFSESLSTGGPLTLPLDTEQVTAMVRLNYRFGGFPNPLDPAK
ncbi:MAG TPA: outer membrane beta-barrel protein [Xanthobacteraceae bacterium]|nr:outer membrane beta-barrel protein [Xanthobacteraceae bacterium]